MDSSNETQISPASDSSLFERTSLIWFAATVALFAGTRFWRLTASCLWFDEIFSVHAAHHEWSGLFYFVAADLIHPPLFYALLKVWISLGGESLVWLRMLPALIGVASIVPFTLLCRELKLKAAEVNLALLLLAVNGYLLKYAQEVRMYSLLFCLSLCSLWLFFRFFNRNDAAKKCLAALCGINLLLIYTHYAGWFFVLVETLVLLLWQRKRLAGFLFSAGFLVVAYAPWVYEVLKVARAGTAGGGIRENIGWVTRPGIFDLAEYFILLNRPFLFVQSSTQSSYNIVLVVIVVLIFGLPLLALFFGRGLTEERPGSTYALSAFLVAPIVIAFLLSWMSPYSFWGTRHLIVTAGPYAVFAAIALKSLRPYWLRITFLAVLGCWLFLSGAVFLFSKPPNFIWCSWDQLARQMAAVESNSRRPVQVYSYEDLVAYHLWFALDSGHDWRFRVTVVKDVEGMREDRAYFLPRAFQDISVRRDPALTGGNIWLAFRATQWDEKGPPLNLIKSSGFRIGRVFSVNAQGQEAFMVQLLKPPY